MPYGFSAGLPRTGQTTVYRAGDDGTYQAGVRMVSARASELVNNGNGTVTDHGTGLVWVRQPELIIPGPVGIHATNQIQRARGTWKVPPEDGLGVYVAADLVKGDGAPDALYYVCILGHPAHADKEPPNATYWRETVWTASAANLLTAAPMTWNAAIDYCEALEYAGFTDWRMPNMQELFSLLNNGAAANPRTYPVFPNMINTLQSSTSNPADTTYAVVLSIWTGTPTTGVKTAARYVQPVRGGRKI
ncbi:MAG: DUF1566 domain-containing protein [Planctomycetota bacterium]|nr:DUF1566 domain-containing protein [Planctomycetota bacterium]